MDIPVKEILIKNAGDLKVLPFVARKVLDTVGDERSSVSDLSDVIEKDQTISARVLKISNSALYGLRQEVTSVHHALLLLGFKTIRSLVLSVSTKSLYKQFGMKEKIIWDHSVGAAIASKVVAECGDAPTSCERIQAIWCLGAPFFWSLFAQCRRF